MYQRGTILKHSDNEETVIFCVTEDYLYSHGLRFVKGIVISADANYKKGDDFKLEWQVDQEWVDFEKINL